MKDGSKRKRTVTPSAMNPKLYQPIYNALKEGHHGANKAARASKEWQTPDSIQVHSQMEDFVNKGSV